MVSHSDLERLEALHKSYTALKTEISKAIIGQNQIIEQLFVAMLAQGHALLVGVPGLAKTLLIKSLSEIMDLKFNRIQFTPDLMPSDITGTEIIEEDHSTGKRAFRFVQGPVFANIVLADEINRTPPKTQAALLEAMQEHRVTASGQTYTLDEPFFVLATQNPIEQEGTYPLPEAQLDRFMLNLKVEYPTVDEEKEIVQSTTSAAEVSLQKVLTRDEIRGYQQLIRQIPVADNVIAFAVDLVTRTRPAAPNAPDFIKKWVAWGAGPRASQYLVLGAKTMAALKGNPTPSIDDIISVALPVLRHRVLTNFNAEADGVSTDEIVTKLLETD
ncbi:MAG: AAA family ATPase [Lentisphaeria bacterium]|nr:AAA family ATPase [Candidatus Neomarinimicrobiota bacterium]MCF7843112.1 AAA family ATPase [Lentisphaeria bacterium]